MKRVYPLVGVSVNVHTCIFNQRVPPCFIGRATLEHSKGRRGEEETGIFALLDLTS
jgi:hypothetical protein